MKNIVILRDPQALKLAPQSATLIREIFAMGEVYKKQVNTITKDLEAIDERRDLAIIGIRIVLEGFIYHFDLTKRNAAKELLQSIDGYEKRISKQNYHVKTVTLDNLIYDWETILELKTALITLDLTDWVEELKENNTSFNETYIEHNTQYMFDSKTNVTQLRSKVKESYTDLINHITAYATLHSSEAYENIVKEINTLTKRYNDLAEKREPVDVEIVERLF
ncbi:DUF6261 family protein [Aquimarina algiphila]|uniref:DUF6261 family protein n=1 Tax=Aquimarina algiphila TaxID=2047982 RepID=UPI00232FAF4E|nr:DUF6261 family protein [Aquimarina algiphila]